MAQRQTHRGRHPEDGRLFDPIRIDVLRNAVTDLSFLRSRDYSDDAALKLVGDHYQLDVRQRRAVLRCACSDLSLRRRTAHRIGPERLVQQSVAVDGYNILITLESILAGGILLRGRDGCVRDMASLHGSYRKVEETLPALRLLGKVLHVLGVARARFLFDAPVSNSGRLRSLILEEAKRQTWPWDVALSDNVDQELSVSPDVVLSSDGWILDRVQRWCSIVDVLLSREDAQAEVLDLGAAPP